MSMPPYLTSPLMINQRKSRAQEWQQKKIKVQDRTKTKKQKNPKQRNLEFHIREVFLLVKIYHNIMQSLKERWKFNIWSVYHWVLLFTGKYGKKEKRENHASFPPAFWGKHIFLCRQRLRWSLLLPHPFTHHLARIKMDLQYSCQDNHERFPEAIFFGKNPFCCTSQYIHPF